LFGEKGWGGKKEKKGVRKPIPVRLKGKRRRGKTPLELMGRTGVEEEAKMSEEAPKPKRKHLEVGGWLHNCFGVGGKRRKKPQGLGGRLMDGGEAGFARKGLFGRARRSIEGVLDLRCSCGRGGRE